VQEWHKQIARTFGARVLPVCDAAVHHRGGNGGGCIAPAGGCSIFPDAACENVPISAFVGERLYELLVAEGEEPVWRELELLINREIEGTEGEDKKS
jgi:hypothetical protein